jgi:hypothetical protein
MLELVHTSFVTSGFEKRDADIIYKLKRKRRSLKSGRLTLGVYFYCLLELQSGVDFFMPVRLLVYYGKLLDRTAEKHAGGGADAERLRLPVIVPLVLYNGLKMDSINGLCEDMREQRAV